MADKLIVYKAKDGWRWKRLAGNNKTVSESGEAYERLAYALEQGRKINPDTELVIRAKKDGKP